MIKFLKEFNKNKVLSKLSEITNIELNKLQILFSNFNVRYGTKIEIIKTKEQLKEALYEISNIGGVYYCRYNYPMTYYFTSSVEYALNYEEKIDVIKGRVKPGKKQFINEKYPEYYIIHKVEPVIERDELTIFIKKTYFFNLMKYSSLSPYIIYVYIPK